ncbi:MAG: arsenate reductase (glutaredoxin) [Marinilabiliales bacterium]
MLKVYHNPRCKKSRAGIEFLKSNAVDFEIIEYFKTGLKHEAIKEILLKMNVNAEDLVRTQEEYYKKELKGKKFNNDEWINIIVDNPKLLKRPVAVAEHKAVLGDPAENFKVFIK